MSPEEMTLGEVIDGLRSGVSADMEELISKILLTKTPEDAILVLEDAVDDGTFESWPMSLGLANYLEDILKDDTDI